MILTLPSHMQLVLQQPSSRVVGLRTPASGQQAAFNIPAPTSQGPGSRAAAMRIPESLQDLANREVVQFLKRPKTVARIFGGVRPFPGPNYPISDRNRSSHLSDTVQREWERKGPWGDKHKRASNRSHLVLVTQLQVLCSSEHLLTLGGQNNPSK